MEFLHLVTCSHQHHIMTTFNITSWHRLVQLTIHNSPSAFGVVFGIRIYKIQSSSPPRAPSCLARHHSDKCRTTPQGFSTAITSEVNRRRYPAPQLNLVRVFNWNEVFSNANLLNQIAHEAPHRRMAAISALDIRSSVLYSTYLNTESK